MIFPLLLLLALTGVVEAQRRLPSLFEGANPYIIKQYIDAITAYGPGLGVFTPYSYVDIAYNNIPFVGKVPTLGKEGTSSRLGISPFYPPTGNPSNPFPPLYRARPLPLHIPEPQELVAVPLDEEALHGEPLFPKELVLPSEMEMAGGSEEEEKPEEPFGEEEEEEGFVNWPSAESSLKGIDGLEKNSVVEEPDTIIEDFVKEKNVKPSEQPKVGSGDKPKSPFRVRIKRLHDILLPQDS